jgi:CheY-like chemotaxis protein
MNPISNIWNHPKTSVVGLLIGVVTIASVLSQQGITLGNVGTGNYVTLASGLAAALLGLLARDPVSATPNYGNSTAKLGAWALIALLLQLPFVSGCSGTSVAQDIVNWTPALQSAVATVDSTASLLAPAEAPIFVAATVGFDDASNLLVAQAKAYLANPTAPVLEQLQAAVVAFQQQVNASLLQAAKITNPTSQQHATDAVNGVATIVLAMLALVQSVSSKAAVARMASQSHLKLAAVRPYLNEDTAAVMVASHYGEPVEWARAQVAQVEMSAAQAGF